jgi:asparagine synthase (glutamine-hydrolysing)
MMHRGPDDAGWLISAEGKITRGRGAMELSRGVALGHRRLSILDLSPQGWQPMSSACGRYHITYNGEIYNYLELKAELQGLGVAFKSTSDTEVLLAAWAQWGEAALSRLKGMFAFGILDEKEGRLSLVRDFFGIKPLFVAPWLHGLAAASEIGPLLALPGVSDELHAQSVFDFLVSGVSDVGRNTMFVGVHRLRPGYVMEIEVASGQVMREAPYWALKPQPRSSLTFQEAADALRERFLDSVRLHMRSDVPIGTCLSGGIDSSAIVCAMRLMDPDAEIHAFTFVSKDERYSELKWARIAAERAGAILHEVHVDERALAREIDDVLARQGEPVGTSRILAQYKVFDAAAKAGIKVMLDGQGADELLAGYPSYLGVRLVSLVAQLRLGQALRFVRSARERAGLDLKSLFMYAIDNAVPTSWRLVLRRLAGRGFPLATLDQTYLRSKGVRLRRSEPWQPGDLQSVLRVATSHTGLQHLLRYEDLNSMAFSVESRVPFLTPDLAEFLQSLPPEYLVDADGVTKAVFRQAMRGIVPDAILDRKDKVGFQTEETAWLAQSPDFIARADAAAAGAPFFKTDRVRQIIRETLHLAVEKAWLWRILNVLQLSRSGIARSSRGANQSRRTL